MPISFDTTVLYTNIYTRNEYQLQIHIFILMSHENNQLTHDFSKILSFKYE